MEPEHKKQSLGVLLSVMTAAHAVASFGNLSIPPLTPFLRDELNLSHAQVGMLTSFIYVGVVSASILSGWVSDIFGERRALILGLGIQGLFMTAFASVHSLFLGGIFLALSGVGYSSVNPATTKGVMRWFPPQGRATAMGIKQTGIPLGGILAASLLPGLALAFGWRAATLLVGFITLAFILVVKIGMPPAPPLRNGSGGVRWEQFREVLSNRGIVALAVMGIFAAGAQLALITHLVLFLKSKFLFSSVLAGICLAVAQAGGIGGRIGWGLVSDYLVKGRRKPILVLIGIIAAGQFFLLARVGAEIPVFLLLVMIALLGLTTIGYHGVLFGLMGEIVRKEVVGLATGFSLTITFLGIVLFPPFFGHLVDRLGSYDRAWDTLALAWVAAVAILVFFVQEKKSAPDLEP